MYIFHFHVSKSNQDIMPSRLVLSQFEMSYGVKENREILGRYTLKALKANITLSDTVAS